MPARRLTLSRSRPANFGSGLNDKFERLRIVREITVRFVLPLTQPLPSGEMRHRTVISRTFLSVPAVSSQLSRCIVLALLLGCSHEFEGPPERTESPAETAAADTLLPSDLGLESVLASADVAIAKAVRAAINEVTDAPQSAAAWGKLAMLLAAHDMEQAAARCFARAAELDSGDTRWPYLRGRALATIDPEAAMAAMERAVEVNQDEVTNPRLLLAEMHLEAGRVDRAKSQIRQTLKSHPGSDRARLLWARAEFLDGNWQECLDSLAQLRDGQSKDSLVLAAEAQQWLGQHQAADGTRRRAESAKEFRWDDPYVQEVLSYRTGLKVALVRADELFIDGKNDQSIAILNRVTKEYPESDWAKILLGRALIRAGRHREAEVHLRAARELAPASVEAKFRLGVALYRQNRIAEAMEQFRSAIRIKPDFTMAYYNLSFCQIEQGDLEGAIRSMRRCVQSAPEYAKGWHRLALLEEQNGDIAKSRQAYHRALALDPANDNIKEQLRLLDVDRTVDPTDLD